MEDKNSKTIIIESLENNDFPGLTTSLCRVYSEACAVCLDEQKLSQGAVMKIIGDLPSSLKLTWNPATQQMFRAHNDEEVATEYGALCIAFHLINNLTDFTVLERSRKGTGFDYWLGYNKDTLFQNKVRLEVSGIRNGTMNILNKRVKIKLKQTTPTDGTLPAYIIVVMFNEPISKVVNKN
jgi:hypothetical protein